jgi:1D-myo-inositol-triphosphate 3-kinase
LLIYDDKKAGAWLIDFAKCTKMEGQNRLSHRAEWELGNHEDGYLIGLDNLVELLADGENMTEMKEENEDDEERHKIDRT